MIWNILQGLAVGTAIILPGLSGGTALVLLGIYRQFLQDLAGLRLRPYLPHFCGAALGALAGIRLIGHAMTHYPGPLTAFLLGMLAASLSLVARQAERIRPEPVALFCGLAAFAAAWVFSGLPGHGFTGPGPDSLLVYFAGGAIASATMLLPGVSGGALLVALGLYDNCILAFNLRQWPILFSLSAGFAVGLLGFARFLDAFYRRQGNRATFLLLGLIGGSTRALVPDEINGVTAGAAVSGALLVLAAAYFSKTSRGKREP